MASAARGDDWRATGTLLGVWFVTSLVGGLVLMAVGGQAVALPGLLVGAWVGVACVASDFAARWFSVSDGAAQAARVLAITAVRLMLVMLGVIVLVAVIGWDRRLVGFAAIGWYVPLLMAESMIWLQRLRREQGADWAVGGRVHV